MSGSDLITRLLRRLSLIKVSQVETKDALLHAINEEYVEAVEVLLDHEESIHTEGEPWSWETLSEQEVTHHTVMLSNKPPSD